MKRPGLLEVLVDLQTILIVALLYWLLLEEQSNAYLRTWLGQNFPLGLIILSPSTVAAISGTLLVLTAVRIIAFVTNKDLLVETRSVIHKSDILSERVRGFLAVKGRQSSVVLLISFGLALSIYAYFVINVIPVVALGISCIILGLTAVSLPRRLGGPVIKAVLQGATLGLEGQLEQYNVKRATYLPPDDDGMISAYVPLGPETENPGLSQMRQASKILSSKDQRGLLVHPIGSELTRVPYPADGLSDEERLRYVLVDSANLCSRIMVEETGSLVIVRMKGADLNLQGKKYSESLGSLPSSLAACVIAMLRKKPLTLLEEKKDGDGVVAVFQLLDGLS